MAGALKLPQILSASRLSSVSKAKCQATPTMTKTMLDMLMGLKGLSLQQITIAQSEMKDGFGRLIAKGKTGSEGESASCIQLLFG